VTCATGGSLRRHGASAGGDKATGRATQKGTWYCTQPMRGACADDAHVADGEIDDPRSTVDQNYPESDHGEGQSLNEPSNTTWLLTS